MATVPTKDDLFFVIVAEQTLWFVNSTSSHDVDTRKCNQMRPRFSYFVRSEEDHDISVDPVILFYFILILF